LEADVFLPPSPPPNDGYPVILHIHGGGFIVGDRSLHSPFFVNELTNRNWVYISFDYRLAPEVKIDEMWADFQDAWNWTLNDAPKLLSTTFNVGKTLLIGESAGGYFSLVGGYKLTPRPKAIIDLFGNAAISGPFYNSPKENLDPENVVQDSVWENVKDRPICGYPVLDSDGNLITDARSFIYMNMVQKGTFLKHIFGLDINKESDVPKIDSWTPARNISKDYPPTYLMHGDQDPIVPIADSEEVAEALKKHGVVHEFVVGEGQEHGMMDAFIPNEPGWGKYVTPLIGFIEKYLS